MPGVPIRRKLESGPSRLAMRACTCTVERGRNTKAYRTESRLIQWMG